MFWDAALTCDVRWSLPAVFVGEKLNLSFVPNVLSIVRFIGESKAVSMKELGMSKTKTTINGLLIIVIEAKGLAPRLVATTNLYSTFS